MTDIVIAIYDKLEDYIPACGLGRPIVPVLCQSEWSRRMTTDWAARQGLQVVDSEQETPVEGKSATSWHNNVELHVLSLDGDNPAAAIAHAFVRMRSAIPFTFPTWAEAAEHHRTQGSDTHTVAVGIDLMPTMRDISQFTDQVGFVAVDTIDLASFIVAKTVTYAMRPEGPDVCFAPIQKGKVATDAGELAVLPADSPQLQDWRSVVDGKESVVSIVGHASEDYLRLGPNELVCGRRFVRPPDATGQRLPTCMVDDGCVLPGLRRTGAADMPGSVFFANACLTLKVDRGIFDGGDSYTVSHRFLEANAAAFVASPLLKDGRIEENLVFHGLMGAGATVGHAVRELNRLLLAWNFEAAKVIVLGDPSIVTSKSLPENEEQTFKKGLLFGVHDEVPHLPDRDCYAENAPPRAVTGFIRGEGIPTRRAILLDRDPRTDAQPYLTARSITPERALNKIRRVLDDYDRVALLDVKIDEGRQLLTDLRKGYPNTVRRAATSRCGAPLDPALGRVLERLATATQTIDAGLVAKLQRETLKSEYHFVEAYRDAYRTTNVHPMTEGCPNCGSDAVRYEFAALGDTAARRWLISCVVCGAVQDGVPDFVVSQVMPLHPGVGGGILWGKVHLHNQSSSDVDLSLGGAVTHGRRHDATVGVSRDRVTLSPGHDDIVTVKIRVPHPENHHPMFLRMYAVAEGRVSFSGREFFV